MLLTLCWKSLRSFILRENLNLSYKDRVKFKNSSTLKQQQKVQEYQFTILLSIYDNIYNINIMDFDLSWLVWLRVVHVLHASYHLDPSIIKITSIFWAVSSKHALLSADLIP